MHFFNFFSSKNDSYTDITCSCSEDRASFLYKSEYGLFSLLSSIISKLKNNRNKLDKPYDRIKSSPEQIFSEPTDNNISEPYTLILSTGDVILPYKSDIELINENHVLTQRIKDLCVMPESIYQRMFVPLQKRFVSVCSVCPASKFLHDCDEGGLFRHSLLAAVKALEIYRNKGIHQGNDEAKEQLFIIFLAFIHDLGKIFTDYKISTIGKKYLYNPDDYTCTLDNFCKRYRAKGIRLCFEKQRNKEHHSALDRALVLLCSTLDDLCNYLFNDDLYKRSLSNFIASDKKDFFYRLIKMADIFACQSSLRSHHPMYETGQYLKAILQAGLIDTTIEGFYRTNYGYIVEKGSPAYEAIIHNFDRYTYIRQYVKRGKQVSPYACFYDKNYDSKIEPDKKEQKQSHLYTNNHVFDEHYAHLNKDDFDREMLFRDLCDSNFYIQGAYKRSCIWRAVSLKNSSALRFVYGFSVNLETNSLDTQSVYRVIREFTDKEVNKILDENKKNIKEYNDQDNITSFDALVMRNNDNRDLKFMIPDTQERHIGYYQFCSLRNRETIDRARNKRKRKNQEYSRINNTDNQTEYNESQIDSAEHSDFFEQLTTYPDIDFY